MVKKNKLYKHHKKKSYLYFKDFAFGLVGLVFIGAAITIPTYIATINNEQISTHAESEETKKAVENDSEEEVVEEEDLLVY